MNIQKRLAIAVMVAGLLAFSAVALNMTSCSISSSEYCAGSKEQDSIVRARTSTLLSQMQYEFPTIPMKLHPTNPVSLIISAQPSEGRKIADRWADLIRHNMINAGPCSALVIGEGDQ